MAGGMAWLWHTVVAKRDLFLLNSFRLGVWSVHCPVEGSVQHHDSVHSCSFKLQACQMSSLFSHPNAGCIFGGGQQGIAVAFWNFWH